MQRDECRLPKSVPKLFDIVELLSGRPNTGLAAGAVGTIAEELPDDFYLVEFRNDDGKTLSVETLAAADVAVRG